jgi:hypothetical protein
MIIDHYQTHSGRMPKPKGKGLSSRWSSAQPAQDCQKPEEKITLSHFFGGI